MSKWRVGDRIRFLDEGPINDFLRGHTGVITHIGDTRLTITTDLPAGGGQTRENWYAQDDWIESYYSEEEIMQQLYRRMEEIYYGKA